MSVQAQLNEESGAKARPTPPAPVEVNDDAPKPRSSKRPMIILAVIAVIAIGGYAYHLASTASQEETDDAQVEGDVVPIAARTGGLVLHVPVHDNQSVHRGDVLIEIDSAEHSARVAQAEAELASAQAQSSAADSEVQLAGANASGGLRSARAVVSGAVDAVRSAQAQVAAARAGVARAAAMAAQSRTNLTRTRALRTDNAISQAELDNAQSGDDAAQAALQQAQAQLSTALASQQATASQVGQAQGRLEQSAPVETQMGVAHARANLAHARVRSAQAALDLARLQLSYTHVVAPSDGVISRLAVHEGQLLQPGQPLAELVPHETYVVANFKETQVGRMHPGERTEIRVDAYPGRTFEGQVESISSGTGARFSLLPPDNASGNFVKVVQRVPVRIRWVHPPADLSLRAGLSADVTVHVAEH